MKRKLYLCTCESVEHMMIVSADTTDAFIEIHLRPLPFWQRVQNAIGYICGRRSKWGDFEEIVLTPEMALDLGDSLVEWSVGESLVFSPNDVF